MCIFIFYIRSATAASHDATSELRLKGYKQISFSSYVISFLSTVRLSCPQTTSEGLKCLTAIQLGVYTYILTTITELTRFASSLHSHLRIKKWIISQLKHRIYSCHKSISKYALQTGSYYVVRV